MTDIVFPFGNEMPPKVKLQLTTLLNRDEFKVLRRPFWFPVTQKGESAPTGSQYGGLPWLRENESSPLCGVCERPMHFFLQLNMQELPAEVKGKYGSGLIQFFYCKRDDCPVENKIPPDRVSLVRLVDITSTGRRAVQREGSYDPFPARRVTQWEKRIDYVPHLEELNSLGIELTDEEHDLLADWGLIEGGDKLTGWPCWMQSAEHIYCKRCRREMQFVFQFDPDINLNYRFGQEFFDRPVDVGCAWLFQCDEHKEEMAFIWQCL